MVMGKGTEEEIQEALAKARAGYRQERFKEQVEMVKARSNKNLSSRVSRSERKMPSYLKGTKKKSGIKGIAALAGAFGIPTGVGAQGGSSGGSSQARVKYGRGRPEGTFTPRFLPGVGMVKMPIQDYKRALSAAKAQIRYQTELQKAKALAAATPPDHLGRGYPGEFQFAEGDEMGGEMPMQMPQEMPVDTGPQSPTIMQRIAALAARRRAMGAQGVSGVPGQQGYPPQAGMQQGGPTRISLMRGTPPAPRMSILGKNSILNAPYVMDTRLDPYTGRPR